MHLSEKNAVTFWPTWCCLMLLRILSQIVRPFVIRVTYCWSPLVLHFCPHCSYTRVGQFYYSRRCARVCTRARCSRKPDALVWEKRVAPVAAPIAAIHGWMIKQKARKPVHVVEIPRNIASFLAGKCFCRALADELPWFLYGVSAAESFVSLLTIARSTRVCLFR